MEGILFLNGDFATFQYLEFIICVQFQNGETAEHRTVRFGYRMDNWAMDIDESIIS